MSDTNLALRCMELAMEQAKREGVHADRNAVAELQTWFYSRISECGAEPLAAQPEKATASKRQPKAADKSAPDIWR